MRAPGIAVRITVMVPLLGALTLVSGGGAFAASMPWQTADAVYWQSGSFTTSNETTSQTGLNFPTGLALDSSGGLYVADTNNHRVLHYNAGSTTADGVYGQGSSFTSSQYNYPAGTYTATRSGLFVPTGLAVDSSGGLYVTEQDNNRILHYPAGSTTPDRVYGQGGLFTSSTASTTQTGLDSPTGVALDSNGGLYAADNQNNRVLHYPNGATSADMVYGQNGSFITRDASSGPGGLNWPTSVTVDSADGLYVADRFNNRVLHFAQGSTMPDRVYGQEGSFTASTPSTTPSGLNNPTGVAVGPDGGIYGGQHQ